MFIKLLRGVACICSTLIFSVFQTLSVENLHLFPYKMSGLSTSRVREQPHGASSAPSPLLCPVPSTAAPATLSPFSASSPISSRTRRHPYINNFVKNMSNEMLRMIESFGFRICCLHYPEKKQHSFHLFRENENIL